MAHCISPLAEEILDIEQKVLDHGFVRLVDYMGNDSRIVQSARVSYGDGTKTVREDGALIDYLLRNKHTSPFEQVMLTFHIKMPIFVARQWIRHRTARVNEISGRYSIMKDEAYIPVNEDIAFQAKDNKQGREAIPAPDKLIDEVVTELTKKQEDLFSSYHNLIDKNIAKEICRINLPLSTYTEMYWQIDLHNLFHFLKLRCDTHAQKEIRDYAFVLLDICRKVAPLATASFENHILNGVSFSQKELIAIDQLLNGEQPSLTEKEKSRLKIKLDRGYQT